MLTYFTDLHKKSKYNTFLDYERIKDFNPRNMWSISATFTRQKSRYPRQRKLAECTFFVVFGISIMEILFRTKIIHQAIKS